MEAIESFLNTLNGVDRDVLFFILAMAAIALAGFCIHVVGQRGSK
ncbi:hypothetical protein ACSSV1_006161 [Labrenzia sp. MBR-25]|jgi:hypothetical protein